jgi:hypothetical protein
MLRLVLCGLAFSVIAVRGVSSQETDPSVSGTYITQALDSAHADSPCVGLTFRLLADAWSLRGEDGELVAGKYAVRGDTLRIWDEAGRLACNSSVVGRYLWGRANDVLRLALLDDECPGRRRALTSVKLLSVSPGQ